MKNLLSLAPLWVVFVLLWVGVSRCETNQDLNISTVSTDEMWCYETEVLGLSICASRELNKDELEKALADLYYDLVAQ